MHGLAYGYLTNWLIENDLEWFSHSIITILIIIYMIYKMVDKIRSSKTREGNYDETII